MEIDLFKKIFYITTMSHPTSRAFLKDNNYHTMIYNLYDIMVHESVGKQLMKHQEMFMKRYTLAELQLQCEEKNLPTKGIKFELSTRLIKSNIKEILASWKDEICQKTYEMYNIKVSVDKGQNIQQEILQYAKKHTLPQLREQCDNLGVSSYGKKIGLGSRILKSKFKKLN
jgi:hypothetical protein